MANKIYKATLLDVNDALALLVEQNGVKDNVLIVDTANGRIGINMVPNEALDITGNTIVSGTINNDELKRRAVLMGV
jgi:hypothetical protein